MNTAHTVNRRPIATGRDGTPVSLAIHRITGAAPGPHLLLIGGIHGDEPFSGEAVRRSVQSIDCAELRGTITAIPVANPLAFAAGTRHTPVDGVDVNRNLPGDDTSARVSDRIAALIAEQIRDHVDYLVDFHSGPGKTCVDYAYRHSHGGDMAAAYGSPFLFVDDGPATTTTGYAMSLGVTSLVAEIGGEGGDSASSATTVELRMQRLLRHLGMLPGGQPEHVAQTSFTERAILRPHMGGVLLSDYPSTRIGEQLPTDALLGRVIDPATFAELEQIRAPFPSNVLLLSSERIGTVAPGDFAYIVARADTATTTDGLPNNLELPQRKEP